MDILDIRVGHVLKFLIAAFATLYVWAMVTAGELFVSVILFKPVDGMFGTGIPVLERALIGFAYLVPQAFIAAIPASLAWKSFYAPAHRI